MNNYSTKISLFILIATIITACNVVKKVPAHKFLLTNNTILVNNKKNKNPAVVAQLLQQPNSALLGFKLRLAMYNMAHENTDSIFKAKFLQNPKKYYNLSKWLSAKQVNRLGESFWYFGWHNFLKKTGEAPVIIDTLKTKRTAKRLQAYFFNQGFFNTKVNYNVTLLASQKASVKYVITTGKARILDSITRNFETPLLDSLFVLSQKKSFLKKGAPYSLENLDAEKNRITTYFRNHGVYNFQQQNINFTIDTTYQKIPVIINISNREYKNNDSIKTKPYKIYRIANVNIFTNDFNYKNKKTIQDSLQYNNFTIYSTSKLRYRPKTLTNAIFIQKDSLYSDSDRTLTLRSLSNLRIFNYPTIQYLEDSIRGVLTTNIFLTPKDKYSFKVNADFTHSNIQDFGISTSPSLSIRNLFRGAEILEIGARLNVGSSKDLANPDDKFFNISELGTDVRLTIPRILFLFSTQKIVPKSMFPSTLLSGGYSKQTNIGLDKENFTAIYNYSWTPQKNTAIKLDLLNIQYVKNINTNNYFNAYQSSYNRLNFLAKTYNNNSAYTDSNGNLTKEQGGADAFMIDALTYNYPTLDPYGQDYKSIRSIKERKERLTQNNFIFSSNFSFSKNSKTDLTDKSFYSFRSKIELAGNLLSLIATATNQPIKPDGSKTIKGLEFSQYIKTEFDYIKHWDLQYGLSIAFRSFFGIAIPYNNSKSIPFSRSYFAGGTNDNRAWQSYSLGPGSSGGLNDFNEANMKIALSTELRFKIFGNLNGALFADCGNIWNIADNEKEESKIFTGIESLKTLALGTGVGFRYDFNFFVARIDLGFKTYNPAQPENYRWFNELNFNKHVLNIGINYPF